YKFVTIYRRVDDESALEQFFSQTHLPLAEQLPGLLHREVSRVSHKPGGESRYHLMFELYFQSKTSFEAAMVTPIGKQLVEALMPWAEAKIITWFFADSFREDMGQDSAA
ncbi:MAG: EthD family reductase, partial [Anaerolineales bacterium]|nr:EthD family reductase [Anaerolineales bacterium]